MRFNTKQHWQFFAEFCREELATGGPDPHMRLVGHIAKTTGQDFYTTAWSGLCYCAVYNVPTAVVLWKYWPHPRVLQAGERELAKWLSDHREGIAFRRERKAVRSADKAKLAKCLFSAAQWLEEKRLSGGINWPDFEHAFEDTCRIYGFGRYIGQKYVEYCRRYLGTTAQVQDIRAHDGWSPRAALSLLFPEHATVLNGGNSKEEIQLSESCAREAKERLSGDFGIQVDYYLLQVLLCDYKQSVIGRRQFPGKSQDSELEYDAKLTPYWGKCTEMYSARAEIIHPKALGELNGWTGVRKELGYVLSEHGYTWSDRVYNYHLSRNNLSHPVRWA